MSNDVSVARFLQCAFVISTLLVALAGCDKESKQSTLPAGESQPNLSEGYRPTEETKPAETTRPTLARAMITDAYAKYGIDDPRTYDSYMTVVASCEDGRSFPADKLAPMQTAANKKLETFCADFNSDTLQKPTAQIKRFTLAENASPAQKAIAVAEARQVVSNHGAKSQLESVGAAMFLIAIGEFPQQESFGVDRDTLIDAYGAASTLKHCRAVGCGPDSFNALVMCRANPCDSTKGYEAALRQISTPERMRLIERLATL